MFQGKEVILIFNLSIVLCMLVSRSPAALFYKIDFLKQNDLSGIVPGCQTVMIQIRSDALSILIRVQTFFNVIKSCYTILGKQTRYLLAC